MSQRGDLTIDELVKDSMVLALMNADHVDPREFEASLRSLAKEPMWRLNRRSKALSRSKDRTPQAMRQPGAQQLSHVVALPEDVWAADGSQGGSHNLW